METDNIDELFSRAVSGEYEDDAAWEAISALRRIGSREVYDKAVALCNSSEALGRARGAAVLGQLGRTFEHPRNNFPYESYEVITSLVLREKDPCPLAAAIAALGHLGNPLAIPLIASFSSNPSSEVRFDVAVALGCFPNEDLSLHTLVQLTEDQDDDVRDWATFGVGVLGDTDSDLVRDTLVRCLSDPNEDVRDEAMVGLGKRKDLRVLSSVISALEGAEIPVRAIEAAYEMLGMDNEREGWDGSDYAEALRKRFAL